MTPRRKKHDESGTNNAPARTAATRAGEPILIEPRFVKHTELLPVRFDFTTEHGMKRFAGVSQNPNKEPRHEYELLICDLCEARFLQVVDCKDTSCHTYPKRHATYDGGWRRARTQHPHDRTKVQFVMAPCICEVGQLIHREHPGIPPVPHGYPPTPALEAAEIHGENPHSWHDPRDIRPISPAELNSWRKQHGIPTFDEPFVPALESADDQDRLPF